MRAATLFSGIGAPEVAAPSWDWRWCAEIEAFPAAVHHARHGVPNLGDVTAPDFAERVRAYGPLDALVFGSPCQSFSVAGKRLGLDDPRGNLALHSLRLARELRPEWLVFENVPGLLSSAGGDDLTAFLGLAAECGYFGAWRVLDAQFAGVPQRRRRLFAVLHLGDWRRAAAVLFEPESLSGHPPPCREAGKDVAPTLSARTKGGGGLGTDFDLDGGLIAFDATAGGETGFAVGEVTGALRAGGRSVGHAAICATGDRTHALTAEGHDASEDGTGRGTPVVAFSAKDHGADAGELAPTLRAMGHGGSHANGGGQVAIAIQERAVSENLDAGPQGKGYQEGVAYTLEARNKVQAVAFDLRGREGGAMPEGPHDTANIRAASGGSSRSYIAAPHTVRRLTPVECERLQGFPDRFTAIEWRGKPADRCPDGPRYKALGNSMAVPVVAWILGRMEAA